MSADTGRPLRALLIGALPPQEPSAANPVGGAAVNFEDMVTQLKRREIDVTVVDISRPRVNLGVRQLWHNFVTVAGLIGRVAGRVLFNDIVVVHISAKNVWWLGSGLWFICTAFRRPVVLKFIGGDFARVYDGYSAAKRRWANATYLRCALILVQTKGNQETVLRARQHPVVPEYQRHPRIGSVTTKYGSATYLRLTVANGERTA